MTSPPLFARLAADTGQLPSEPRGLPRIAMVLRGVAIGAAAILLVWLLWSVLLLVFFAVLLGATLRGVADWLAVRTRVKASWMLACITILLVALVFGLAVTIGPSLAQQGSQLAGSLTNELKALQDKYGQTAIGHRVLSHLQQSGGGDASKYAAPAFKVLGITLDFLATLILLVITALYLAISPDLYIDGTLRLVPLRHRRRAREVMHQTGRTLRRWLLGQIADMIAVAVLTSIGLMLLGVPVPLALGAIAGLLTFIPYFGAALAGLPAVLVALSVSPHLAGLTVLVFLGVHLIEGYVISPLIQKRMVELPPAITVMAMTASGTLFGPLGIILGTPLAAAGMVVVRELYVADMLGDDEVRAAD